MQAKRQPRVGNSEHHHRLSPMPKLVERKNTPKKEGKSKKVKTPAREDGAPQTQPVEEAAPVKTKKDAEQKQGKSTAGSADVEGRETGTEKGIRLRMERKLKAEQGAQEEGKWVCKCGNENWARRLICNSRNCKEENPNGEAVKKAQAERERARVAAERETKAQALRAEGKEAPEALSRNQKRKLLAARKREEAGLPPARNQKRKLENDRW